MKMAKDGSTWARHTGRRTVPKPDVQRHFAGTIGARRPNMLHTAILPRRTGRRGAPMPV